MPSFEKEEDRNVFHCGAQMDKQHLNLSSFAYDTIQSDIYAFRDSGWSSFINRIFSNFYPVANASISLALERQRKIWMKTLALLPNRQDAIAYLMIAEKKRLKEQAASYPRGRSIKFRLNNQNYSYLTGLSAGCKEGEHYRRGSKDCAGLYIKAVMEEYAHKSFLEREAIYFLEYLECISDAISQQKQLKVTTQGDLQFYVRPYSIATDKQSAYHYLVGLSSPINQDESEAAPFSFRLSKIQHISLCRNRSGFLKSSTKAEFASLIAEKGAAFLGDTTDTVRVRLTEIGKQMYQNMLHLRPAYIARDETDNQIYTFECTPMQIKFYFLQFGEHAQILSPSSLAEEFRQFYHAALRMSQNPQV